MSCFCLAAYLGDLIVALTLWSPNSARGHATPPFHFLIMCCFDRHSNHLGGGVVQGMPLPLTSWLLKLRAWKPTLCAVIGQTLEFPNPLPCQYREPEPLLLLALLHSALLRPTSRSQQRRPLGGVFPSPAVQWFLPKFHSLAATAWIPGQGRHGPSRPNR